jgi:hypothetical protein
MGRDRLTAALIAYEAGRCLQSIGNRERGGVDADHLHKPSDIFCNPGQYAIAFGLPPDATRLSMKTFSKRFIHPAMHDLSLQLPSAARLLPWTDGQIPKGVDDAAAVVCGMVAIRCVMYWRPNCGAEVPKEWQTHRKYYDAGWDEVKEAYGAMFIRFDVQTERPPYA